MKSGKRRKEGRKKVVVKVIGEGLTERREEEGKEEGL